MISEDERIENLILAAGLKLEDFSVDHVKEASTRMVVSPEYYIKLATEVFNAYGLTPRR